MPRIRWLAPSGRSSKTVTTRPKKPPQNHTLASDRLQMKLWQPWSILDTNCTNLHELTQMNELLYKQEVFQLVGFCMEIHRELGKGHDEWLPQNFALVFWSTSAVILWNGSESFCEISVNSCNSCKALRNGVLPALSGRA